MAGSPAMEADQQGSASSSWRTRNVGAAPTGPPKIAQRRGTSSPSCEEEAKPAPRALPGGRMERRVTSA
jgi:hypothetical protein